MTLRTAFPGRWLVVLALVFGAACQATPPPVAPVEKAPEIDADPLALLPAGLVAVAAVDVRAALDVPGAGSALAELLTPALGLVPDPAVDPLHDIDRLLVGTYSPPAFDVAALALGRFDAAKIAAATSTRGGVAVTRTAYAGRDTFVAGPLVYAVLTPRTMVLGTSDGVRRVLDRVAARATERAIAPWMVDVLMTPGAVFSGAADLASQPVSLDRLGLPTHPWLDGAQTARVTGKLEDPGLRVTATVVYADATRAAAVAEASHSALRWVRVLGPLLGGVSIDEIHVEAEGAEAHATLAVDDRALAKLLGLAKHLGSRP